MKVLSVASECAPLVKTGGLADVVGALPGALAPEGVEMRVMLPAYPGLLPQVEGAERVEIDLGGTAAHLVAGKAAGLPVILLDAPALYARDGAPYAGPDGVEYPDNAERFGLFARAAAEVATQGFGGWQPDAVHAHDWQAALVPAYLRAREAAGPPVLLTVHNIAFQGVYAPEVLGPLGLPESLMTMEGLEYHGQVGFLKAGLAMAERISTVSPRYARELTTPDFGFGLEGLLRHRAADFSGILNGVDADVWNPETDPHLAATYSAVQPDAKATNRAALADRFGLVPQADAPLCVVISRMSWQKGLDLLLDALPALLERGGCLAVLGTGDAQIEAGFAAAAEAHPRQVSFIRDYDEPLSHLMQGGGDAILIPSRFEPCGLTQLYGLRYGTLPVAALTGGLADTVIDANDAALAMGVATGFLHQPGSVADLEAALTRLCDTYQSPELWATLRANAMVQPVGWARSAAAYKALYAEMGGAT